MYIAQKQLETWVFYSFTERFNNPAFHESNYIKVMVYDEYINHMHYQKTYIKKINHCIVVF